MSSSDSSSSLTQSLQLLLTEEEIRELYKGLNVNLAELLGLRLYTGRQARSSFHLLVNETVCR